MANHEDDCEPWGYVASVVAAVVTRATGVRYIYFIDGLVRITPMPTSFLPIITMGPCLDIFVFIMT